MTFRFGYLLLVLPIVLAACGNTQVAQGINDPYETRNRAVHEFNKSVDRTILRPIAGSGEPGAVMKGVTNFAGNLGTPGAFVNDVLQANVDDAAHNFARFLINTTIGIAGIFDPATAMGLHARDSDFGETLHVWGFAEGHYVELPLLGPSTKRDAIGKVVDVFTNPLRYVFPAPERYAVPAAPVVASFGSRSEFGDTIDSILYESEDSYAQTRILYLENRRFHLGGAQSESLYDDYDDYDDFYDQ